MRSRTITVLLFILMFGVSSDSQAFLEWLHKLSGPGPFIGVKMACRFTCEGGDCRMTECGAGYGLIREKPKWTASLGGGGSFSYDNDLDYEAGTDAPRVWIWSLEPSFECWFIERRDLFVGLGYSLNEFQGREFEDFRRDAWVLRLGHRSDRENSRIHAIEFGVKYMIFEDRFRPEDFGAVPGRPEERGVVGFFTKAYFWKGK